MPTTRYDNTPLFRLEDEHVLQVARLEQLEKKIADIHGKTDYSDELAKHFHLGKVGFRKDTKRSQRTLDQAIAKGVKACELYGERDRACARIDAIAKTLAYIRKHADLSASDNPTANELRQRARQNVLDAAPELKWERKAGGHAYGEWHVKKIDSDFVVVYHNGERVGGHYRTVSEAKAVVAVCVSKGVRQGGVQPYEESS